MRDYIYQTFHTEANNHRELLSIPNLYKFGVALCGVGGLAATVGAGIGANALAELLMETTLSQALGQASVTSLSGLQEIGKGIVIFLADLGATALSLELTAVSAKMVAIRGVIANRQQTLVNQMVPLEEVIIEQHRGREIGGRDIDPKVIQQDVENTVSHHLDVMNELKRAATRSNDSSQLILNRLKGTAPYASSATEEKLNTIFSEHVSEHIGHHTKKSLKALDKRLDKLASEQYDAISALKGITPAHGGFKLSNEIIEKILAADPDYRPLESERRQSIATIDRILSDPKINHVHRVTESKNNTEIEI